MVRHSCEHGESDFDDLVRISHCPEGKHCEVEESKTEKTDGNGQGCDETPAQQLPICTKDSSVTEALTSGGESCFDKVPQRMKGAKVQKILSWDARVIVPQCLISRFPRTAPPVMV